MIKNIARKLRRRRRRRRVSTHSLSVLEKVAVEILTFYFQRARGSIVSVCVACYLRRERGRSTPYRRGRKLSIRRLNDMIARKYSRVSYKGTVYVLDSVERSRHTVLRFKKTSLPYKPRITIPG